MTPSADTSQPNPMTTWQHSHSMRIHTDMTLVYLANIPLSKEHAFLLSVTRLVPPPALQNPPSSIFFSLLSLLDNLPIESTTSAWQSFLARRFYCTGH
jgi:hypothetical protein